ncbi:hypothetical protein CEXT_276811 [Caerostris extrusa]|uniref:Uncharacterized protein n=1 Tax=Caerostris extrusa TaxID=172846 RepID=A0AAV4P4R6_CAEEX|nr:hypothetical protein CEXT_276811 [Caerostris extrusa]
MCKWANPKSPRAGSAAFSRRLHSVEDRLNEEARRDRSLFNESPYLTGADYTGSRGCIDDPMSGKLKPGTVS